VTHDDEYNDSMVRMLELIWGEGYMAPGGPGNVARLLRGMETRGKRVLDIGCGLGGPAFEMARTHGATVVGIDLEAPLVARARRSAAGSGLDHQCTFHTVEAGALPFDDKSFDVVVSSGAVTQTEDAGALFTEARRVLKPGGWLTCYEWLRTEREYSDDMRYWFRMEGLTYAMKTLAEYERLLREAGYTDVDTEDATDWYRREARREYDLMRGALYPTMLELLGEADAEHFVENWRAMLVVIDSGEMRQGYLRGRRPGSA
jgi:phosphoethanolamine N-methyltransferase